MDAELRSETGHYLLAASPAIARVWRDALVAASPALADAPELLERLTEATQGLLRALAEDPFPEAVVQDLGIACEAIDGLQPPEIVHLLLLLGAEISAYLPAERYLQLVELLLTLEAGFFVGKARRAGQFNMGVMSKMGHDLKTPINAITGFSRVIIKGIDGPVTELQQEDLTSIFEAGRKLLTMINDLFAIAKADVLYDAIYAPRFAVSDLLADVMRAISPLLARRGHTFEVRAVGDLGFMDVDASQVRWILLSLLLYAGRVAENNTISLGAHRETVHERDWLVFEIAQRLPGQVLNYADVPHKTGPDVAGWLSKDVGLASCWRFCSQLGGVLDLVEGELAKFTVRLPAVVPAISESEPA